MDMEGVLKFLSDLEANNNKEWFHANKPRYQEAGQAFESLVQALIFAIGKTDSSILQQQAKDLTFKLNRDTRFSHDKSPYNPAFRAHISSKGKLPIPVGYFLVVKPGNRSLLGGGLFADMFRDATTMVRDAIAEHGEEWQRIISEPAFRSHFSVAGTALKKVPQGYDASHPQAEYLKYKSWYLEYPVTDQQLCDPSFVSFAAEVFILMQPFNRFLNNALETFQMPAR